MSTVLYRLYDHSNHLLYVGIAGNVLRRTAQHLASKDWFAQVKSATFEHYPTRDEAAKRERTIIQYEHPRHNIRRYDRVTVSHTLPSHYVRTIEACASVWQCTKSEAVSRLIIAGTEQLGQRTPSDPERAA